MSPDNRRKPLLHGRGAISLADFADASGLDLSTVQAMTRSGKLLGLFDEAGAPVLLFDDTLPTAADLAAVGLTVSSTYDPENLRSYEEEVQRRRRRPRPE